MLQADIMYDHGEIALLLTVLHFINMLLAISLLVCF
jgi:hypothetical protein